VTQNAPVRSSCHPTPEGSVFIDWPVKRRLVTGNLAFQELSLTQGLKATFPRRLFVHVERRSSSVSALAIFRPLRVVLAKRRWRGSIPIVVRAPNDVVLLPSGFRSRGIYARIQERSLQTSSPQDFLEGKHAACCGSYVESWIPPLDQRRISLQKLPDRIQITANRRDDTGLVILRVTTTR
jgi:hypothetical protein